MGELQLGGDAARLDGEAEHSRDDEQLPTLTRQRDFGTGILLVLLALVLGSAVLAFTNPFSALLRQTAAVAQPREPVAAFAYASSVSDWCLRTEPYGHRRQSGRFRDDGLGGDPTAGDNIFSIDFTFAEPGVHYWEVVACDDARIALPEEPAWLFTTIPDQSVRLSFDVNDYGDVSPGLWPVQYALSAEDDAGVPQAVGSFQGWQRDDPASLMELAGEDFYRLVYVVAEPGQHNGIVVNVFGDDWHAYSADGRSAKWNGFDFETATAGEAIVVELDKAAGRSAIFYGASPQLIWLAYQRGFYMVSAAFAGLALLLAFITLKRYQLLRRPELQIVGGCPRCNSRQMVRIPRHRRDRLLTLLGVRNGRFTCRDCDWQGLRLIGQAVPLAPEPPRLLAPVALLLVLFLVAITAAPLIADVWVPGGSGEMFIARLLQQFG